MLDRFTGSAASLSRSILCSAVAVGVPAAILWLRRRRKEKAHPLDRDGNKDLLDWHKSPAWMEFLDHYDALAEKIQGRTPLAELLVNESKTATCDNDRGRVNDHPLVPHLIDTEKTLGSKTKVWTRGPRDKPKVILVHGMMSSSLVNYWSILSDPRFYCNYFLIAVDAPWDLGRSLPKHDRLVNPKGTKGLEGGLDNEAKGKQLLAPWLKQVVEGVGLETVDVLMGYSYGAQVAAWAVLFDPGKGSLLFGSKRRGTVILGSPPSGFSAMPPPTTTAMIKIRALQKKSLQWPYPFNHVLSAGPYGRRERNVLVRLLEWWYEVPDRTAAGMVCTLEQEYTRQVCDLGLSIEDSSFAGFMQSCYRSVDSLIAETDLRQVPLWPLFPKVFTDEQLDEFAGEKNSDVKYRSILMYPENEIYSDPATVRRRAAAAGIPVREIKGATHMSCFVRDAKAFGDVLEKLLADATSAQAT
eukprot:TRINITY_DN32728_c0_g1_i1.p1 TRINITY_DN32728_c0_g1~~TRINITY_DN32728_c0_g1_i1.p1  ORF type:complete len:469 (-),score=46.21 TRINITY_DN32728_c0_g1_i1:133-1539(-)